MKNIEFSKDLLNNLNYYYLKCTGSPELSEVMSETRLLSYADHILEGNKSDEDLPEIFRDTKRVQNINEAEILINWFGEEIFLIEKDK